MVRSRPRFSLVVGSVLAAMALFAPKVARADDATSLANGINSYEGERYDECIDRFTKMLSPGDPTTLKESNMKTRARMYLAACLIVKNRGAEADVQMRQLIRDDPRFAPDAAAFPSKVLDRFTEARAQMKDEIERIERERLAKEEEERKSREEERKKEQQKLVLLQRLAREEVHVSANSRWVAMIPFGAGQFQNRQPVLGWIFLGAEVAAAVTTVTFYFQDVNLINTYQPGVSNAQTTRDQHATFKTANEISAAAFLALVAGGIAHAQITFVPEFREVEERTLPPDLVVVPAAMGKEGGGLVMSGRF